MNNIKFSIVLPTLRYEWLAVVLDSIYDNAAEPEQIEVHLAINTEDRKTQEEAYKYIEKNKNVFAHIKDQREMIKDHPYFGMTPYVNWLTFDFSRGEYVMPMNDDALFISKNWDINAYQKFNDFLSDKPDGIVLGRTEDFIYHHHGFNGSAAPIVSFPFISRKGIDHFGFLFSPDFYHNTADGHISFVYYNMNRIVDLRDVVQIAHRPSKLTCWEFLKEDRYTDMRKMLEAEGREEIKT
jgi:hypothetical protein